MRRSHGPHVALAALHPAKTIRLTLKQHFAADVSPKRCLGQSFTVKD